MHVHGDLNLCLYWGCPAHERQFACAEVPPPPSLGLGACHVRRVPCMVREVAKQQYQGQPYSQSFGQQHKHHYQAYVPATPGATCSGASPFPAQLIIVPTVTLAPGTSPPGSPATCAKASLPVVPSPSPLVKAVLRRCVRPLVVTAAATGCAHSIK